METTQVVGIAGLAQRYLDAVEEEREAELARAEAVAAHNQAVTDTTAAYNAFYNALGPAGVRPMRLLAQLLAEGKRLGTGELS